MRRSHRILVILGFVLIFGSEVVYVVLLARADGARIRSPQSGVTLARDFIVSGDAWARGGIESVAVIARQIAPPRELVFPASRDWVRFRGARLYPLSTWSARVALPADGPWRLEAVARSEGGARIGSAERTVEVRQGAPSRRFRAWSAEHLVPIAIIVAAAVALGLLARRRGFYEPIAFWCTVLIWVNELSYQLYWFEVGGWSTASSLMFQMCGLSILLLPLMHFQRDPARRQFMFDVLYFWGIGGAIQALMTPDLGDVGFPAYRYFSFFLSHGLIITLTVVMALAGGVRISFRSLLRAFVVTNLTLIPIYGLDQLLRLFGPYEPGNYFVLGYPPPTGSPVDLLSNLFGPSPRYVVGLEIMGILVFLVLWLPWLIARWVRGARAPTAPLLP